MGKRQPGCLRQFGLFNLEGMVGTCLELSDAARIDVKAQNSAFLAEFDREGQTDVAQPDDRKFDVLKLQNGSPVHHVHEQKESKELFVVTTKGR